MFIDGIVLTVGWMPCVWVLGTLGEGPTCIHIRAILHEDSIKTHTIAPV